eukprot:3939804-Rhodomonas_salina.1
MSYRRRARAQGLLSTACYQSSRSVLPTCSLPWPVPTSRYRGISHSHAGTDSGHAGTDLGL